MGRCCGFRDPYFGLDLVHHRPSPLGLSPESDSFSSVSVILLLSKNVIWPVTAATCWVWSWPFAHTRIKVHELCHNTVPFVSQIAVSSVVRVKILWICTFSLVSRSQLFTRKGIHWEGCSSVVEQLLCLAFWKYWRLTQNTWRGVRVCCSTKGNLGNSKGMCQWFELDLSCIHQMFCAEVLVSSLRIDRNPAELFWCPVDLKWQSWVALWMCTHIAGDPSVRWGRQRWRRDHFAVPLP